MTDYGCWIIVRVENDRIHEVLWNCGRSPILYTYRDPALWMCVHAVFTSIIFNNFIVWNLYLMTIYIYCPVWEWYKEVQLYIDCSLLDNCVQKDILNSFHTQLYARRRDYMDHIFYMKSGSGQITNNNIIVIIIGTFE